MIHDHTKNISDNTKYSQNLGIQALHQHFPKLVTSNYRMTRMFLNRCESQVLNYSNCINNTDWKADIEQFIGEDQRKQCYSAWHNVRQCSTKNLGESFTIKLDAMRRLTKTQDENEYQAKSLQQYNNMMKNQLQFLKEDMPVEGESEE
mmetsp:Transcript_6874/g.7133  ORF Transcript_6874/g.7133 Transcript_6874/m.7133 type:complete len:148 (+) Transcript_6874:3-446(+)